MLNEISKNNTADIEYICFVASEGNSIDEQITNCYIQLSQYLNLRGLNKSNVIKQTVFVNTLDKISYYRDKKIIIGNSSNFFQSFIPTGIIPQPPLGISNIAFEFALISDIKNKEIKIKKTGQIEYFVIQATNYTQVIVCGLGSEKEITDISSQSIDAFEQMYNILKSEKMNFSHVFRQWNYLENIVCYSDSNQHYQIFNDVRSAFYNNSDFMYGYPAATGIGIETGGVIIDFMSIRGNNNVSIIPVTSPVQRNAHQYSKEVLAHSLNKTNETTPKFERAKAIIIDNSCYVYVSGTAAIKGEFSFDSNDAAIQTSITIESIKQLITKENLKKHNINSHSFEIKPCYFRVYIKNPSDYLKVKSVCDKYFGNTQIIFLKADICRPELLVEIEGIYMFTV